MMNKSWQKLDIPIYLLQTVSYIYFHLCYLEIDHIPNHFLHEFPHPYSFVFAMAPSTHQNGGRCVRETDGHVILLRCERNKLIIFQCVCHIHFQISTHLASLHHCKTWIQYQSFPSILKCRWCYHSECTPRPSPSLGVWPQDHPT